MRFTDYTDKIFDFLAENLRRLAEVLSVKRTTEIDDSVNEGDSSAPRDWLERTRNIPAENWFGISVEEEFELPAEPDRLPLVEETDEEIFVSRRPKTQKPSETPSANISKKSSPVKSKSATNESSFLTFKRSSESEKKEAAAPPEPISKIPRQTREESAERRAALKPKFRLSPAETVFERDRKISDRPASSVESSAEKRSRPDAESSVFKREDSFVKREKSSIEREKSSAVKPADVAQSKSKSQIVKRKNPLAESLSDRPEDSSQFAPKTLSPKIESETSEISFKFPHRKASAESIVNPKAERVSETSSFPPRGRNKADKVRESAEPERERKREKKFDHLAAVFIAAEAPWADLPDEPETAREIENDFTENEHIRFLEYEQTGRT